MISVLRTNSLQKKHTAAATATTTACLYVIECHEDVSHVQMFLCVLVGVVPSDLLFHRCSLQ